MNYFYGAVFLLIGLILMLYMKKENKIFIFIGAYFIILGAWWIVNQLIPAVDIFAGVWGWILRGLGAVTLVVIGIFYCKNIYKANKPNDKK